MNLVLIGYMGSGKTAVGKALANTLNYPFKDLDLVIEDREGNPISKIFSDQGEIYFRKKESEILKELIDSQNKLVLSTGGGTPCYGDSMEFLLDHNNVKTIYLKSSLEVLSKRLYSEKNSRPLISHLKEEEELTDFIRKHLFERTHVYERSSEIINTDGLSIDEVVEEIVLKLF
ncbi:MAG: shikimate kinase [Bacteroidia bacterium]|nr:shikimate kinase [Bacteroidia bacterium]NNF31925.1 shikimate kinase [Flavobacteriaceae bacterium]MBT8275352.1 shikimate kinase [Bacteroidia bacterium]NNJ81694.1 shikimate kinase [Flavobacteriaceae bacterium]NNK53613.1 shikimate kinase [Flavobacteriaceae bacterium]